MKLSYLPGSAQMITKSYFGKSRINFVARENEILPAKGIRCHSCITALFMSVFLEKKFLTIKDVNGKIYHLNRDSLSQWLIEAKCDVQMQNSTKKAMRSLTPNGMSNFLEEALKKKSPQRFIKLGELKNNITFKEQKLQRELKHNWPGLENLQREINELKQELSALKV